MTNKLSKLAVLSMMLGLASNSWANMAPTTMPKSEDIERLSENQVDSILNTLIVDPHIRDLVNKAAQEGLNNDEKAELDLAIQLKSREMVAGPRPYF